MTVTDLGTPVCTCSIRDRDVSYRLPPTPLVLLVVCVAACSQPRPVGPTAVNLSGYSQPFKEGFAAGCKTARGTPTKDEVRFRSDADYKLGWDDGVSVCGRR